MGVGTFVVARAGVLNRPRFRLPPWATTVESRLIALVVAPTSGQGCASVICYTGIYRNPITSQETCLKDH